MRPVPPALWILAPLLLAGLYVALHALVGPTPTREDVVPGEAILVHRFRDLGVLDEAYFGAPPVGAPSEWIGEQRNLRNLQGVDRKGPLWLVVLPRAQRHDPTMMIFSVRDRGRIESTFFDPSLFLERGHVRHAQYLEVHGGFAAVGGDRDAVRRLGEGGLQPAFLGEDHALALDVPAMVRFAALSPAGPPWREILEALGMDVAQATRETALFEEGRPVVPAGRLGRVHEAWRTAKAWFWAGRLRADLEPQEALAWSLAAAHRAAPVRGTPPAPPHGAEAWVWVPGAHERVALAEALFAAGVDFPLATPPAEDGPGPGEALGGGLVEAGPLGDWWEVRGDRDGGLLLYAVASPDHPHAWTLGVVARAGALPDLTVFHPAIPAQEGRAEVGPGEMALTRADLRAGVVEPAAVVLRRRIGFGGSTGPGGGDEGPGAGQGVAVEAVLLGAAAPEALARLEAHLAGEAWPSLSPPEPPEPGLRLLATFFLAAGRAEALLGPELEPHGLFSVLAGGDVEGDVWTDGHVLRIEARARR